MTDARGNKEGSDSFLRGEEFSADWWKDREIGKGRESE